MLKFTFLQQSGQNGAKHYCITEKIKFHYLILYYTITKKLAEKNSGGYMLDQDDDLENEDEAEAKPQINRKKMLIFILPVLIVIGLSVGFYYVFNRDYRGPEAAYNVVKKGSAADGNESITVFYDLPGLSVKLRSNSPDKEMLRLQLNIELSDIQDIPTIEALTPKINDIILSHIIELTPEEVQGSAGLYWLKEELLYRLNLITDPIKISGLNIKSLEIGNAEK